MKIAGGMMTALITPFQENGEIDFESLKKLVHQQIEGGVDGFVVSGTTAESPNLSNEEIAQIYKVVQENSPENFQIVLGVGTNSTQGTIAKMKALEALNPSGYLVVVPYYNKPTQAGMVAHFKAVAAETDKDILLYDVPGRTVVEMAVETVAELSKVSNIVGIKDATGNLEKFSKLKEAVPSDFILLSGDDDTTCGFVKSGGHGVISVLSHVIPKEFKRCMQGEEDFAKYSKLCGLLFAEPNPTPVKFALCKMGVIANDQARLPLLKMSHENAGTLLAELQNVGAV